MVFRIEKLTQLWGGGVPILSQGLLHDYTLPLIVNKFYLTYLPNLSQLLSWLYYFLLLLPPPHQPPISIIQHPLTNLFISPYPHIISRRYVFHPQTVLLRCLSLFPARSAWVLPPCPVSVWPLFPPVVHRWYLHLLFVPLYLPTCVIFHLLSSSGVWFMLGCTCSRAKARSLDASTPCQ